MSNFFEISSNLQELKFKRQTVPLDGSSMGEGPINISTVTPLVREVALGLRTRDA